MHTIRSATQILQISVPASRSSLKTVHWTVFFTLRPSRVQVPSYQKNNESSLMCELVIWCERRDLNPYGITTRPSNVRVCRFRHSRKCLNNITPISAFVNIFFEFFKKSFSQLNFYYSTIPKIKFLYSLLTKYSYRCKIKTYYNCSKFRRMSYYEII